jgi:hypothetical protein
MRRLHNLVGILDVPAFLATCLSMRRYPGGMATPDGGTRMPFRSRHIDLLPASLLNLGMDVSLRTSSRIWTRFVQVFGALLILAAPSLLATARIDSMIGR